MEDRGRKLLQGLRAYSLRLRIRITAQFSQQLPSLKRYLLCLLPLTFLTALSLAGYMYYDRVVTHLIGLNTDSNGNRTEFFPTLFAMIGVGVLGVLAITFSLSLFAIQQAADRYTPSILRIILEDWTNRLIFLAIAVISLIFFVFAFLPLNQLLFYQVLSGFLLLIAVFCLIRKQYRHSIRLINPITQISSLHTNGIKLLDKIDKKSDLMIKAKVIRPSPKNDDENIGKEEQRDQLRAGLMVSFPNLFDPVKKYLEQIYALINTYLNRKDYEVTKTGFYAIYSLCYKYIDVKNGTFFPSSMIPTYDFSHDDFLTDVCEQLTAIQRVASKEKDLEISKQIMGCFSQIAIRCAEIRYRTNPLNEYPHCMLFAHYMYQNIEDSLNVGLLDIGIQGSENIRNIGLVLIQKNAHTDVGSILDYLSKIAMYGIAKRDANYLISYPLQVYSIFVRAILFNIKFGRIGSAILVENVLEKSREIIVTYVELKDLGGHMGVEMEYSVGNFVGLLNPVAMPHIFDELYARICDKKTKTDERKELISRTIEFADQIGRFYDGLCKCAAQRESFLIHYIDSSLHHISMAVLEIYQSDHVDAGHKREILDRLIRIISNYWRIYDYHKKITRQNGFQVLEHLLDIGYKCNKLSLGKELKFVVDSIISIGNSFLEKQETSYGFDCISIVERATYLCILNGSENLQSYCISKIKDRFWDKYCQKYGGGKDRLFQELLKIDPDYLRLNKAHSLNFEDHLLAELRREDIAEFVNKAKIDLK